MPYLNLQRIEATMSFNSLKTGYSHWRHLSFCSLPDEWIAAWGKEGAVHFLSCCYCVGRAHVVRPSYRSFAGWAIFLKNILFIFLKGGGQRGKEKHQRVVASHASPTGDLAGNPGMYPGWESNHQPFGSQASAHSTEPHQPGLGGPSWGPQTQGFPRFLGGDGRNGSF